LLGTPAVTTRGFKEDEIIQISNWICDIVLDLENEQKIEEIKNKALSLCTEFPVYK
jgi:Glycine/serine hydroxymethyltransferase